MQAETTPRPQAHPAPTVDRRSCAWLDGVGPGFATGVSGRVAEVVASAATPAYRCARR